MRTLYELYEHLCDYYQGGSSVGNANESLSRQALRASLDAFRNTVHEHTWSYWFRRETIVQNVPVDVTFSYDASTRTLTLSSGTVPSWWEGAVLVPTGKTYAIATERRVSSTVLIMQESQVAETLPIGSTGKLYHAYVSVPARLRMLEGIYSKTNNRWIETLHPAEDAYLMSVNRFDAIAGVNPCRATILWNRRGGSTSGWLSFDGWPLGTRQEYELLYYAQPPDARYLYFRNDATVSIDSSGVCTFSSSVVPVDAVGKTLLVSEGSSPPTYLALGESGQRIEQELRIIARGSASQCTVEGATAVTERGYVLTDPLEIPQWLWSAVQQRGEHEIGRILPTRDREVQAREQRWLQAMRTAMENDPKVPYDIPQTYRLGYYRLSPVTTGTV